MGRGGQHLTGAWHSPSESPPPRASPSQRPVLASLLAFWPGGPGLLRCGGLPEASPLHRSKALLTSRLQSLGSKNRCHLGAETDGKRWPCHQHPGTQLAGLAAPSAGSRPGRPQWLPRGPARPQVAGEAGSAVCGLPGWLRLTSAFHTPSPCRGVCSMLAALGLMLALLLTAHLRQALGPVWPGLPALSPGRTHPKGLARVWGVKAC